jgi:aminoglycoside phosphotransferase (APT) family kinase protein
MARREASTQEFCARAGYPAPRVLDVLHPDDAGGVPVQVMERVAGATMLDLLTGKPWRFRELARELGRLHARLHAVPADEWPHRDEANASPPVLPMRRLGLARRVASEDRTDAPAIRAALARVEPLLYRLEGSPPVLCHGDFLPLNVLVDGKNATVIDWTDSCLGDRHGDVARLLCLLREVRIANPGRAGRVLLRAVTPALARLYLQGYESIAPPLDRERLRMWEPVHLLHDWARSLLTLDLPNATDLINPAAVTWIRRRVDRSLVDLGL